MTTKEQGELYIYAKKWNKPFHRKTIEIFLINIVVINLKLFRTIFHIEYFAKAYDRE